MGVACLGPGLGAIGRIIPGQEGIDGPTYQFRYRHTFPFCPDMKTFYLLFC